MDTPPGSSRPPGLSGAARPTPTHSPFPEKPCPFPWQTHYSPLWALSTIFSTLPTPFLQGAHRIMHSYLFFDGSSHICPSWHTALPKAQVLCLAHRHHPSVQPGTVTLLLPIKRRAGLSQSSIQESTVHVNVYCCPQTSGPQYIMKQNGTKCPLPPPQTSHSSGLIKVPPCRFQCFHSVTYNACNKFSPLSFTCSALPFCHLIIHLTHWASPQKNLKLASNLGAGPRGHVGF